MNGERISSPTLLAAGDIVRLGATRMEVIFAGGHRMSSGRHASPTPVEAKDELRPVSVLFADIVGSTPLAERLEPEDFTALIGGCVDRMCRAVEQFGGVIDAYMGDGIAAFFGFPAATEDDADRAASAALRRESDRGYADEVRKTWGSELNVRVGVNSGQVAIGVVGAAERHPVALGDTMNVAARLQGNAEPGTIVIGGATARKLRGRFLVTPLGHVAVRGRERPVEAWRLLSERPDRARAPSDASRLVGRAKETAHLAAAAEALRAGRGQLVLVDGEPGIGKTRLLEWLRDELRDSVTWLEGHCVSYGGQALYHAPAEALRSWVAVDDVVERTSTLERLGLEPDSLPYLASILSSDPQSGDVDDRNGSSDDFDVALRDAYARWLGGLCRERPVVLAIHDIHWADQGTVELIERLLSLLDERPLMIATTSRIAPDANDRRFRERARLDRAGRMLELRLGPLSQDESDELLSHIAPGELEPEARREVIALAEGNPLYLEQLLRSLLESGGLEPRRTWALTVPASQLPTGLESLLVARIAALPRDARRVAQVGAVLGRTFAPSVLAPVAGVDELERNLGRLLRANIIHETRPVPNREFAFTHGLLQEAALSTLTRARDASSIATSLPPASRRSGLSRRSAGAPCLLLGARRRLRAGARVPGTGR